MDRLNQYMTDYPMVTRIILILIIAIVIFALIKLIKFPILKKVDKKGERYRLGKLINFIGYFALFIIAIFLFSGQIEKSDFLFGAIGAGLTVALKDVVLAIAGWYLITVNGIYKLGDRIEIDGIVGDVIDITTSRTSLMEIGERVHGDHYSGRIIHVSNNTIFSKPVINFSGDFPFIWDEIEIPINYGSDYDLAHDIIEKIAIENTEDLTEIVKENWDRLSYKYYIHKTKTKPSVSVRIKENYVLIRIRYAVDVSKKEVSKTHITKEILKNIEATQGKIKFYYGAVLIEKGSEILITQNPQ